MPDSTLMQNQLRLLHNINPGLQHTGMDELINLLRQSDVALGEMNVLKNESDAAIGQRLNEHPPLP